MRDIETDVFSRIVSIFDEDILTKYDMSVDDNFSTLGSSPTDAIFPFVYVHLLPAMEVGNNLENDVINGVNATIEINVIDNVDASRVKEVMDECTRIMKGMRFKVSQMPEFSFGTYNRQIARYSRYIGADDTL